MGISLDNFKKVEFTGTARPEPISADRTLTAIFKVTEADYVPPKVHVRARIDSMMFTGSFVAGDLWELESDQRVISLAISRPLGLSE